MRTYDVKFKKEAIKLSDEIGSTKASKELGVPINTLISWRQNRSKYGEAAFVGSGTKRTEPQDAEKAALEKENRELRKANEILKGALSFFVKAQKD